MVIVFIPNSFYYSGCRTPCCPVASLPRLPPCLFLPQTTMCIQHAGARLLGIASFLERRAVRMAQPTVAPLMSRACCRSVCRTSPLFGPRPLFPALYSRFSPCYTLNPLCPPRLYGGGGAPSSRLAAFNAPNCGGPIVVAAASTAPSTWVRCFRFCDRRCLIAALCGEQWPPCAFLSTGLPAVPRPPAVTCPTRVGEL